MAKPKRKTILVLATLGVAVGILVLRPHERFFLPFNGHAIGAAEARMWKAYYSGDGMTLGRELVTSLQKQFFLPRTTSMEVAQVFATAAVAFQRASGNYEAVALEPLRRGYEAIRKAAGTEWDSEAAARAELEWWVRRRTPGMDSIEHVGDSIARLYAILYGKTNERIERAGRLRAEAAKLRDEGGDWGRIEALLKESYHQLAVGVR